MTAAFEPTHVISFTTTDLHIQGGKPTGLVDLTELRRHRLLGPGVGKLEWGSRHLATLEHTITQTFAEHQTMLRAEFDPESGYHSFRVVNVPDIDQFASDFTNAVADIANNLRAALNQFAWQLACSHAPGGVPNDPVGVKFPHHRHDR